MTFDSDSSRHSHLQHQQQQHEKLITQLRAAKILENGNLDKTGSNITFDLFDAFRLSLIRYTEDGIEVILRK